MGKTPFQKHREEEERKKKRAEAEAAKLYEDFVESFGEGDEEEKSFVKGETIQPNSSFQNTGPPGAAKKGSSKYVPSFMPPGMAAAMSGKGAQDPRHEESVFPLPSSGRGDRGKPRNIDKMLETMKREQDERAERQRQRRERGSSFGDPGSAVDDGMGSFDDGDPYTTNLYVGNLATTVDEEVLKREFLRYGDIASIKVMWPRDDDQRRRARNCGFVAFMTRQGAEKAKAELNGVLLHDLDLKIGWGKAVVLPPIPVYTQSGVGGLAPMLAAAKAKAMSVHAPPGQHPPAPWKVPEPETDPQQGVGPELVVKVPEDARARFIVDSVACYVLLDGCAFEQALMTRESRNPEYAFLFDLASPDHLYYRWRLYSLAQGDSLRNWRNEPFVMVEGGPRWIPPPLTAAATVSQQTAAQRGGEAKDKDNPLSDLQRDRFEDLLRALTMERAKICEAMVFAIDNADSAAEVVEILSDSLTLSETPMTTKVARLMLASDVLHNSTAPVRNASRYRGLLEACLPDVFESMQGTYAALESKVKQEVLRRNVLRVLRIWRSWFIFSDDYLNGLQATFLKGGAEVGLNPALREELDGLDGEALALRCRRNGLSRAGDREAMTQRLISLQAYLHGEMPAEAQINRRPRAVEEAVPVSQAGGSQGIFDADSRPAHINLDGAGPAAEAGTASVLGPVAPPPLEKKEKKEPKPVDGPVSKWTLVDDEDEEAAALDQPRGDGDIFQDLATTPIAEDTAPTSPHPPLHSSPEPDALAPTPHADEASESRAGGERMDAAEEGRRARLRQVEVKLLMLREDLEDKGLEKAEVESKIQQQREKLMASAEQANEAEVEKELEKEAAEKPTNSSRENRDREKLDTRSSREDKELHKPSKRARTREESPERIRDRGGSKRARSRERSRETSRARSQERSWRERSRSASSNDRNRRSRREDRDRSRGEGLDRKGSKDSRRRSPSPSRERRRSRSRDRTRSRGAPERDRRGRDRSHSRDRGTESKQGRKRERSKSRDRPPSKASKQESSKEAALKAKKESKKEKAQSRSPKKSKKEHKHK